MGWLRLVVGSIKLQVSFAEYSLVYRALFAKETYNFIDPTSRSHPICVNIFLHTYKRKRAHERKRAGECVWLYVCAPARGELSLVYVFMYVCVFLYACVYAYISCVYLCIHLRIHIHTTHTYIHMNVCVPARGARDLHPAPCVSPFVPANVHAHVYIYHIAVCCRYVLLQSSIQITVRTS